MNFKVGDKVKWSNKALKRLGNPRQEHRGVITEVMDSPYGQICLIDWGDFKDEVHHTFLTPDK